MNWVWGDFLSDYTMDFGVEAPQSESQKKSAKGISWKRVSMPGPRISFHLRDQAESPAGSVPAEECQPHSENTFLGCQSGARDPEQSELLSTN